MNGAQRRGAGGGKFYRGRRGVEGWWQRREQMLGLFIASENIPVWMRWKAPIFPLWADTGRLVNNGPRLAPAGHRTVRRAPSERRRFSTWMFKCWFVSQGGITGENILVNDISVSNSVCLIPLDVPDRWGLPHRTVQWEWKKSLGNHRRSADAAFSLINNLILSETPPVW